MAWKTKVPEKWAHQFLYLPCKTTAFVPHFLLIPPHIAIFLSLYLCVKRKNIIFVKKIEESAIQTHVSKPTI